MSPRRGPAPLALALLLALGCRPAGESPAPEPDAREADRPAALAEGRADPPGARRAVVEDLRKDAAAVRHPSDGGGRARHTEEGPLRVGARSWHRWSFVYEAGPLGIAEGGSLFLIAPPFWGWSRAQTRNPDAPGYTEAEVEAPGVQLEPLPPTHPQLVGFRIAGRALRAGERVRVAYGAGSARARSDHYAEREERFWFAVDGDGDGVRELVAGPPEVEVVADRPTRLLLHLPSTARPGETVRLALALVDGTGNAGVPFSGAVALRGDAGLEVPARVELRPEQGGVAAVEARVLAPGVYRVSGSAPEGLEAESNPLRAAPGAPRLLWGDLHGHSNLSDGTGTPEDWYRYARDVAALDVASLTDHDHWGMPFLDRSPERWERIRRATEAAHQPGRFVALLGFEWTNWIHGHRHVLYFDGQGEVVSSLDPASDEPAELWAALRGRSALTFAHHSAGGPVPVDWSTPPDPELEPVTELVSVHGSSEAPDSPLPIYDPVPGNFVRDVLDRGYRLGFVGSGDTHDGHPGLGHLVSPSGGVAGIWSEERTREGVLEALRARRVYATNGPRILLEVSLGGRPMGSRLAPAEGPLDLVVRVVAPEPLERLDVIRSGRVVERVDAAGARELDWRGAARDLVGGDYLYVRAVQADDGAAWSSPFFVH